MKWRLRLRLSTGLRLKLRLRQGLHVAIFPERLFLL